MSFQDIVFPSSLGVWCLDVVAFTRVWVLGMIVYRLWFYYALAKVPGPQLAGATYLYSFYYNSLKERSLFFLQVEKLHKQCGADPCSMFTLPVSLGLQRLS